MNRRLLIALIVKESLQVMRDPSSILIAFVLPMVLLFIFAFGVNLDSNRLKIGLTLEANSGTVDSLKQSFDDSRYIAMKLARNSQSLQPLLINNNLRGLVDVPALFTPQFLQRNQIAELQVIADGSEPQIASFVENYVMGLLDNWLLQEQLSQGRVGRSISLIPRYWYNEELKSENFLIPGSIVIIMTIIGSLLTALVIAREWERGTMEAIFSTPISLSELIVSKLLVYFMLGMGSMFLCTLVAVFIYGVPFRGSVWALSLVSASFLSAALGQGLLISTVAKNQFLASQMAVTSAFLPALNLSGFIFEIHSMPKIIQLLTYCLPARYFITSMQTLFLTGDVWRLLIRCIIPMLCIGCLFLGLTLRKTKKRLD